MTASLTVPDISEWQGKPDWAAIVRSGHPAAIIRVYNGSRSDYEYTRNRAAAHKAGTRALGLYAYMTPGNIERQAREFVSRVGELQPGEWPIVDYEAKGLHPADATAWIQHVADALHGSAPWLYTGEYLYRSQHLGKNTAVPAMRTWLAAYGSHEPDPDHALWQYTSHGTIKGVRGNVDLSVFHGSIEQLLALTHSAKPKPKPKPSAQPYPAGIHPGGTTPSARPLQRMLKATGWMDKSIAESDHYGPATQKGVAGFNAKHGLRSKGVSYDPAIGPRGWALLAKLAYG